jgi:hypothetical protein
MLSHRLQVLIDPDQYERLRREAAARGIPVGALVREAIDRAVPRHEEERRAALDYLMQIEPIPVPDDPAELEAEIRAAYDRAGGE